MDLSLIAQLAAGVGKDVAKPPKRRSAAISDRMLQPPSANVTARGAAGGAGTGPEAAARRASLLAAQRVRTPPVSRFQGVSVPRCISTPVPHPLCLATPDSCARSDALLFNF